MRRMVFEKTGKAVWMSHLDLMRLMQRAFRRAGVLLHHSQGFTPHAYVSMLLPLSVGMESRCEIMEYELEADLAISSEDLNRVLPEGVRVLEIYESARKAKELTRLVVELALEYDRGVPENAVEEIEGLFRRPELLVEKRTKRGPEETDILPLIHHMELTRQPHQILLRATICAQNPSLNPALMVAALERHLPEFAPDFVRYCRREVLDDTGAVFR